MNGNIVDAFIVELTEVDDRVFQITFTANSVTLATRLVLIYVFCISDTVVAHVFTTTLNADFKISVSMNLRQVFRWDPTLTVKAVNILANDMLQVVLL